MRNLITSATVAALLSLAMLPTPAEAVGPSSLVAPAEPVASGPVDLTHAQVGTALQQGVARPEGCFFERSAPMGVRPAPGETIRVTLAPDEDCVMRLVARCIGDCATEDAPAEEQDPQTEEGDVELSVPMAAGGPCQQKGNTASTTWSHYGNRAADTYTTAVAVNSEYLWKCESGLAHLMSATGTCAWANEGWRSNNWRLNQCIADGSRQSPSDGYTLGLHGGFQYYDEKWWHGILSWLDVSNAAGGTCYFSYYGDLPGPLEHSCGPAKGLKKGKWVEADPRATGCDAGTRRSG